MRPTISGPLRQASALFTSSVPPTPWSTSLHSAVDEELQRRGVSVSARSRATSRNHEVGVADDGGGPHRHHPARGRRPPPGRYHSEDAKRCGLHWRGPCPRSSSSGPQPSCFSAPGGPECAAQAQGPTSHAGSPPPGRARSCTASG